jgi:hypothetical protein
VERFSNLKPKKIKLKTKPVEKKIVDDQYLSRINAFVNDSKLSQSMVDENVNVSIMTE